MTQMVRTLTADDKALLAISFFNAGIKVRIRKFPTCFRVVFDGDWSAAAEALNSNGFLHATGKPFERFSFQDNQAFVYYMAA